MSGSTFSERVGKAIGLMLAAVCVRACFACAANGDGGSVSYEVERANNRQAVAYSHKVQADAFDAVLKQCIAESRRVRQKAGQFPGIDCTMRASREAQQVGDKAWRDTKRCIAEKGAANCPSY